jgi:hypothetical protein
MPRVIHTAPRRKAVDRAWESRRHAFSAKRQRGIHKHLKPCSILCTGTTAVFQTIHSTSTTTTVSLCFGQEY